MKPEQRARRGTSLTSARLGDGTTRILVNVPDAVAARLHTYLEAFTSPRHEGVGEADRIPVARQRGQAFCALLEAIDPKQVAELGPADRLTAAEARRLACAASIIPAVLAATSEVLDLGRSSRLFNPAQRTAMTIRDRECRAPGLRHPRRPVRGKSTGPDPGRVHRPQGRSLALLRAAVEVSAGSSTAPT